MRVLVCGGRDYTDVDHVHGTLFDLDARRGPITCLIHGEQSGADSAGKSWVQMMVSRGRDIEHMPFAPEWAKFGLAAGPMRNQGMLDDGKPDLVLAFPGHFGTADMVRRAKAAGVEVIEVKGRGR